MTLKISFNISLLVVLKDNECSLKYVQIFIWSNQNYKGSLDEKQYYFPTSNSLIKHSPRFFPLVNE